MKTVFIALLIVFGIQAKASIFANVYNLPQKQVGFSDTSTHQIFFKRFSAHSDSEQKIIDLANLRFSDLNGDQCITAKEYQMFLNAEKLWNQAPKDIQEQQLKAFLRAYWIGAFVDGEKETYINEIEKLEAKVSGKMLYVLWNSVIKPQWPGPDNKLTLEEVKYFADTWDTFLSYPKSSIHKEMNEEYKKIGECKTLHGPKKGAAVSDPLEKAKEVAAVIEAKLDDLKNDMGQWTGKAGPATFFGALYGKTREKKYLELSLKIFAEIEKTYLAGKPNTGLIYGTSGFGLSALYAYKQSGEKVFLEIAEKYGSLTKLNDANEYAEGSAGIGIFMLNLYLITKNEKWLKQAEVAATSIIERATVRDGQAWWIAEKEFPAVLAGFGHGSAGVGYFLINLYEISKNEDYKKYALLAAEHVLKTAYQDEKGDMHWTWYQPPMGYGTAWKYQWSHGNFGIAYFFDALRRILQSEKWADVFAHTLRPALDNWIEYRFDEGGVCCGKSGAGDLFLSLYRETAFKNYLDLANEAASYLVGENGKVKLTYGRIPAEYDISYSGLTGIGLYFLQLSDPLKSDLPYQIYLH